MRGDSFWSLLSRLAGAGALAGLLLLPGSTPRAAEAPALTLSEAIERAMAASGELALARIEVEKAEIALRDARDAAEEAEEASPAGGAAGSLARLRAIEVTPLEREVGRAVAEAELAETERRIRRQVEEAYFGAALAERRLALQEEAVSRLERELAETEAAVEVGSASRLDLLRVRASLEEARAARAQAEAGNEQARYELNLLLDRPLEERYRLVSVPESAPAPPIAPAALDTLIERLLAADSGVLAAAEAVRVAETNLEVTGRVYTGNTYVYKTALAELEAAREGAEQARDALHLEVRGAWLELRAARERFERLDASVAAAAEVFELSRLRREAGVAAIGEVLDAHFELSRLELARAEALHDLLVAHRRFADWQEAASPGPETEVLGGGTSD